MRASFRRTIASAFLAALLAAPAFAAPAGAGVARQVARGWLRTGRAPLGATLADTVTTVSTVAGADGRPLFHLVATGPEGFVVVSGDTLIEPIVCFSDGPAPSLALGTPLGDLLRSDMAVRVDRARAEEAAGPALAAVSPAAARWAELESLGSTATATLAASRSYITDTRVAPLLKSTWNQEAVYVSGTPKACYNYFTPAGVTQSGSSWVASYDNGNADNYPSGCVATAMAQVMRYLEYPTGAIGFKTGTILIDDSHNQSHPVEAVLRGGNGSGGAYDWSNMPLSPSSSITDSQRQMIGAVCFDAGIALGMEYSSSGSGSWAFDLPAAFKDYFNYDNAIVAGALYPSARAGYTSTTPGDYLTMTDSNLDAGLPVIYGIYTDSLSGHCVVADGYGYYGSTLYHHINVGWGGSWNAWYNLPAIDAGGYSFSIISDCVYNIFTSGSGEIVSGRVVDGAGFPIAGAAVRASGGGHTYDAVSDGRGIFAFKQVPSNTTFTIVPELAGYQFSSQTVSTGKSATNYNTSWNGTITGYTNKTATTGNRWGVTFAGTAVPIMAIDPPADLSARGRLGGVYSPGVFTSTVANTGFASLNWTVASSQTWLSLSKPGGTNLLPGLSDTVTASIDPAAVALLGGGTHSATLTFTNAQTGETAERTVTLETENAAGPAWRAYR